MGVIYANYRLHLCNQNNMISTEAKLDNRKKIVVKGIIFRKVSEPTEVIIIYQFNIFASFIKLVSGYFLFYDLLDINYPDCFSQLFVGCT